MKVLIVLALFMAVCGTAFAEMVVVYDGNKTSMYNCQNGQCWKNN
jgi:hypothetical protein